MDELVTSDAGRNLLWELIEPRLFAAFLIALRMLGVLGGLPATSAEGSESSIPARVFVIATLTGFFSMALGFPQVPVPTEPLRLLPMMVIEFLVGAGLGFLVRLLLAGVEAAGAVAAGAMSLTFASQLDPTTGEQSTPLASLLLLAAGMLFVILGGHQQVVAALAHTFRLLPVGQAHWDHLGFDVATLQVLGRDLYSTALRLAAPVLVVTTLVNVGLAISARAAPQLNLFGIGFALLVIAGLLVLDTTLSAVQSRFHDRLPSLSEDLVRTLLSRPTQGATP